MSKPTAALNHLEEFVTDIFHSWNETFSTQTTPPNHTVSEANHASGFKRLDEFTNGFAPGSLTVIAARPSLGATSFALAIAGHNALRNNTPVLYFTPKAPARKTANHLIFATAQVSQQELRTQGITDNDFIRLADTAGRLTESKIHFDDTPNLTFANLELQTKDFATHHREFIVIVDDLQTLEGSSEDQANEVARQLKVLARELAVPVIALNGVKSAVDSRTDPRPTLKDLHHGETLSMMADTVLFIYRHEMYRPRGGRVGEADILISKNSVGPRRIVTLNFNSHYGRFSDPEAA